MILNTLSLINYKNFSSKELQLDSKINCFVGNNGVGKTNILDAVYHLSFGKSYFNAVTSQNIKHGTDFFVIDGKYNTDQRDEHIVVSTKKGQKKIIKRNGKTYDKLSDHIGLLPLVIISPADRDLITEGSETRRKFIDGVISQENPIYLQHLLRYNKTLSQRNALLKYFAANSTFNNDTLSIYNQQLEENGNYIVEQRKLFLEKFTPLFIEKYNAFCSGNEEVTITYKSQLTELPFSELLDASLSKDRMVQYTTAGIHKDDLRFKIDGYPIKKFGSQGQQKSFLIALKLAQFEFIKQQKKVQPILLLDDIFDKLDETRVSKIIQLVDSDQFGQLFISDTHAERTENIVKKVHQTYKIFNL